MNRIRKILLHMCVICSLVCITAKILDWYNPYMDFTGHIWGIQMVLYISAIVLGITRNYAISQRGLKQKRIAVRTDRKNIHLNRR